MSVKLAVHLSMPLPDENELPNLLVNRHERQCRTSHGNRKLAPESQSTDGFRGSHARHNSLVSSLSFGSSKSPGPIDLKVDSSASDKSGADPCQKAFPLKAAPLKRWQAAAKIQGYLSKWRTLKGRAMSDPCPQDGGLRVEIAESSRQAWVQHWPEEPDAPTQEDLAELSQLEWMLIERHGTIAAAYTSVTNSIRMSSGKEQITMTKRQFRVALCLAYAESQSSPGSDRLEQMFDNLLRLHRRRDGDISKAEFLRFPELLHRERVLQERASDANNDLVVGSRLLDRFKSIKSSMDAVEVFQKALVALQLEPARTTNVLYHIASAPAGPGGLTSAISNITRIAQQFGGPQQGVRLEVLLASWSLCAALAKQAVALGVPPAQVSQVSKNQNKPAKASLTSKIRMPSKFGKKYKVHVDASPQSSGDDQNQKLEHEYNMAFWQALPTGEILWNVSCGAEKLNDEDFKNLLSTAWGLFDDFDAVGCLLGPVGLGRMRPKLDALLALNLEAQVLGRKSEHAHSQLQSAGVLLQQIASMCQADPRLARIAGLFGASLLAGRICSRANASVNFADGALGSAAAQVNRAAVAVTEELLQHVEELLGDRKVECCLSSGQYKIIHASERAGNPLAEWHQNITAQVLAKATAKRDGARLRSEEPNSLYTASKCLVGYSNLQGL